MRLVLREAPLGFVDKTESYDGLRKHSLYLRVAVHDGRCLGAAGICSQAWAQSVPLS